MFEQVSAVSGWVLEIACVSLGKQEAFRAARSQLWRLTRNHSEGSRKHGFLAELWTLQRVNELVRRSQAAFPKLESSSRSSTSGEHP